MSLRELIKDKHDLAENHRFVKYLFGGNISPELYLDYLYNQLHIYRALEEKAKELSVLDGLESIQRNELILEDIKSLSQYGSIVRLYPSTQAYIDYVLTLDVDKILAHIYVRHMGDMFGGAMLKKVVPGEGKMYEFDNKNELIQKLRSKLHDGLAEEANVVFDYAIRLYEELSNEYHL